MQLLTDEVVEVVNVVEVIKTQTLSDVRVGRTRIISIDEHVVSIEQYASDVIVGAAV